MEDASAGDPAATSNVAAHGSIARPTCPTCSCPPISGAPRHLDPPDPPTYLTDPDPSTDPLAHPTWASNGRISSSLHPDAGAPVSGPAA